MTSCFSQPQLRIYFGVAWISLADKTGAKLNLAADNMLYPSKSFGAPTPLRGEGSISAPENTFFHQPEEEPELEPPFGSRETSRSQTEPQPLFGGAHVSIQLFFFLFSLMSNTARRLFSGARLLNRPLELNWTC